MIGVQELHVLLAHVLRESTKASEATRVPETKGFNVRVKIELGPINRRVVEGDQIWLEAAPVVSVYTDDRVGGCGQVVDDMCDSSGIARDLPRRPTPLDVLTDTLFEVRLRRPAQLEHRPLI